MDDVTVQDLITHAFDQKPIEFQNAFNSIMLDKVSAAIDDKKLEVAQSMFNPEYNDDSENDEVEDEIDGRWERVAKPRVFRDSLIENAVELVDLLKHFNLTNDPTMEQARLDLRDAINDHDAQDLRDNFVAREAVKSKVDEILGKFNF